MPSDELPHTPYVLSYSHPSSAHRSVDLRCHGVGGGNGGGEGGGDGGGDGGGEGDAMMLPVAPNRKRRPVARGYLPSQLPQAPALPTLGLSAFWLTSVLGKSTAPVVPGHNTASVTAKLLLPRKLSWNACCCISAWPPSGVVVGVVALRSAKLVRLLPPSPTWVERKV